MFSDIVFIICTIAPGNIYLIPVIVVINGVILMLMSFVIIVVVSCCIVQHRRTSEPGIWNYNNNKFILYFTILCTGVCYPSVTNEYVTNSNIYIYIYILLLYLLYYTLY